MNDLQGLAFKRGRLYRGWTAGWVLLALVASGCATRGPVDALPPVPMGEVTRPPRVVERSDTPFARADLRVPGWDAPDLQPPRSQPVPPPRVMDEEVMRLQIMLDRANFSPGCIDGRFGHQSKMALQAWQGREGLPVTGELDDALRARLDDPASAFITHTVSAEDAAGLAPVPTSWRAKAQVPALAHSTVLERLAEQYHLSQRALKELNPAARWPDPAPGTTLRVPRVKPWPKPLAARMEIHLAGKYLRVFDYDDKLVAHFPCSIARDKEKRPVGELHVVNAAANPNYTFRPELFSEDAEAALIQQPLIIPPGPNNPVGVAWLSLDRPGYGLHGTPKPEDIGRTESHGCFRLANWNARKVLDMVTIGIPVTVFE